MNERFRVPAISVTGSDVALGEWFFAFPMGSHFDEPIFWADLLVKGGHNDVGVLMEQSLVGEAYVANFRKACRQRGIQDRRRGFDRADCPRREPGPCVRL